jgi:hypothetical protein
MPGLLAVASERGPVHPEECGGIADCALIAGENPAGLMHVHALWQGGLQPGLAVWSATLMLRRLGTTCTKAVYGPISGHGAALGLPEVAVVPRCQLAVEAIWTPVWNMRLFAVGGVCLLQRLCCGPFELLLR